MSGLYCTDCGMEVGTPAYNYYPCNHEDITTQKDLLDTEVKEMAERKYTDIMAEADWDHAHVPGQVKWHGGNRVRLCATCRLILGPVADE